jgi:hypothetical protein
MTECKFCGSPEGYYTKWSVYGSVVFGFTFDGEELDNDENHDLIHYRGGDIAYCINCDKRLGRVEEVRIHEIL